MQGTARHAANFNQAKWDRIKYFEVRRGILAKFQQNPRLGAALVATGDATLVEASSSDRVWGIGLAKKEAKGGPAAWMGQNLLGLMLMDVRATLAAEGGFSATQVNEEAVQEWELVLKTSGCWHYLPGAERRLNGEVPDWKQHVVDVQARHVAEMAMAEEAAEKARQENAKIDCLSFHEANQKLLDEFSMADWEKSEAMLKDQHHILLDQRAKAWLRLTALDEEMNGNDEKMQQLCKQAQVIFDIQKLGSSMKGHPHDLAHCFFANFKTPQAQQTFQQGVDRLLGQIKKLSVQKLKEQEAKLAKAGQAGA